MLLGGNFIAIDEANTSLPNGLLLNATDSGNSQDGPTAGGGSGVLAVFALLVYVTAFSLGMGPGAWLIPSEVFSLEVRARAMSLATFSNRSLAAVAGATFLSLRSALSNAGVCFLFAVLTLKCILAGSVDANVAVTGIRRRSHIVPEYFWSNT